MWTRRAVSDMGLRSFSLVWSHKDTQLFWVSFEEKKKRLFSRAWFLRLSRSLSCEGIIYMNKH